MNLINIYICYEKCT